MDGCDSHLSIGAAVRLFLRGMGCSTMPRGKTGRRCPNCKDVYRAIKLTDTGQPRRTPCGCPATVCDTDADDLEADTDTDDLEADLQLKADGGKPTCHYCGERYEPTTDLETSYYERPDEHNVCCHCLADVIMNDSELEPLAKFQNGGGE